MPLHLRAGHPRAGHRSASSGTARRPRAWSASRRPRRPGCSSTPTLMNIHYKALGNYQLRADPRRPVGRLEARLDDLPNHEAKVLYPYNPKDRQEAAGGRVRARDARALPPSRQRRARAIRPASSPEKSHTFADGTRRRGRERDHQRQEGIPVHPGRLLQAELPDGLPRQGRHAHRQSLDEAGARRPALGPDQGGRPGRRRRRQPADGADHQGDQQQPRHADHGRAGHGDRWRWSRRT